MDKQIFQEELELAKHLEMLENIAKTEMTKDAVARYGRLKLAHPDVAIKAIAMVAQAVNSKQLRDIDDAKFKSILMQIHKEKNGTL